MLFVQADTDGRLLRAAVSNTDQPGWTRVEADTFPSSPRDWRLVAGALVHDPLPVEAPPPSPVRVAKGDIWRRATDAEAETIDAALAAQPVRLRNLFRDATYLSGDDELFPTLRAGFVQAFGETRADELLAPSSI